MKKPEQSDAFRNELESLQKEFEAYLSTMLSVKTIRNHSHVIGVFIDYVCFDCRIKRFQDITRGIARSYFRRWYMSKVGNRTEREVDVAIRKFFQFLASEKKIVNEAVLKSFEK
jgi:site-specific recombinase XerD